MRILILGAGATGGYFGGRLVESGEDVTFLVRPRRAEQLRNDGLVVRSQFGNIEAKQLQIVENATKSFDVIILSCKSYDLQSAMDAVAPAVADESMILPLLNGMAHVEELKSRFGAKRVLGGCCIISSELDENGHVLHLNRNHSLRYGELSGEFTSRIKALEAIIKPCKFSSQSSSKIVQDMWEKWVMIASLAALTTMMRAAIGQVARSPGGKDVATRLVDECLAVLRAHGFTPSAEFVQASYERMVDENSTLTASMLRDLERGSRVEGDQIFGDFIERAKAKQIPVPTLEAAYCNVCAYEKRSNEAAHARI